MMRSVWCYVKNYRLQIVFIIIFSIISMIASIVVPYLNGLFIDRLITSEKLEDFIYIAFSIIAIGLFGVLTSYYVNISITKTTANTTFDMLSDTVTHLQKVPLIQFHSKFAPSYIIRRISEDINVMISFFLNNFVSVFLNLVLFLSLSTIILLIDIDIFVVSMSFLPLYYLSYRKLRRPLFTKNKDVKEKSNRLSKTMFEQIDMAYEIKVDASFDNSLNKEKKSFLTYLESLLSYSRISYLFSSLDGIMSLLFQSIILFTAGLKIIKGSMTVGEFTIVNTYFAMLLTSTKYYFNLGRSLQDYRSSSSRMEEIYDLKTENNGSKVIREIRNIQLSDVTFSYDNLTDNVVCDTNLSFDKGSIYLITGPNGVGKTTVINIIIGIIQEIETGSVKYNNVEIKDIDLYSTRQNTMSVLLQHAKYTDCTVGDYLSDNLKLGKNNIREMILLMGLDKIYLSDNFNVIDSWDRNINNLSGGQKQRMSLLKTLGKSSSVVILDEPSNGLDIDSTVQLTDYLHKSKENRITIVISHDDLFKPISDKIIKMHYEEKDKACGIRVI